MIVRAATLLLLIRQTGGGRIGDIQRPGLNQILLNADELDPESSNLD